MNSKLIIFLLSLFLAGCFNNNKPIENREKDQLLGLIDSLVFDFSFEIIDGANSAYLYLSLKNENQYNEIMVPAMKGSFPEDIETSYMWCMIGNARYEMVIVNNYIDDTIVTLPPNSFLHLETKIFLPILVGEWSINDHIAIYPDLFLGNSKVTMINLCNNDTLYFNKAEDFKTYYKLDWEYVDFNDSIKMNKKCLGGLSPPCKSRSK